MSERWTLGLALVFAGGCQGLIADPVGERPEDDDARIERPLEEIVALDTPRVWRLSNAQYARSVDSLLGFGGELVDGFLDEVASHGFANSIDNNTIGDQRILGYQYAAQELAQRAVEDPSAMARIWSCDGAFEDATCVQGFIDGFGSRAFRRPLLNEERQAYEALFVDARGALGGPTAVQLVVETMLQSPSFLYRTEVGPLDEPEPEPGEVVSMTPHESLSLLSYTLWGGAPDPSLDPTSELATEEGMQAVVQRMLEDPRLLVAFEDFVHDLLGYHDLDVASPAVGYEDDWDGLRQSMAGERREFLDHLLFSGEVPASYGQLMTADYNFADARLAPLYGVDAPTSGYVRVETGGERPGILGQAGVLAAHSLPDGSSPPRRGKLVAQRLLCRSIPAPPDNLPIPEGALDEVTTTREFFEAVTGPGTCGATCHSFLNPPGFAFEHFDAVGRWRDTENGDPVNSAVDLAVFGLGPVAGASGLGQALAGSSDAQDCFARELYRFAMGRVESGEDEAFVQAMGAEFRESEGDLRTLLAAMLTRAPMHQRQMPE